MSTYKPRRENTRNKEFTRELDLGNGVTLRAVGASRKEVNKRYAALVRQTFGKEKAEELLA